MSIVSGVDREEYKQKGAQRCMQVNSKIIIFDNTVLLILSFNNTASHFLVFNSYFS